MSPRLPVVLVTGASSGIGRAVALAYARRGARVALVARRADKLASVAAACGEGALATPADVSDPAAVRAAVARVTAAWGAPDVLVNGAGVMTVKPIRHLTPEEFHTMVCTNYLGAVYAVTAALPAMLERGTGTIINISSLAGKVPARGYGGYAPSKFALAAFTDVLRQEVAPRGIHVLGVYPGPVDTALIRDASGRKVVDDIPGLPLYTAEYVAERILAAAARRRRDLYLPGWRGRFAALAYALCPRLVDALGGRLPIRQNQID